MSETSKKGRKLHRLTSALKCCRCETQISACRKACGLHPTSLFEAEPEVELGEVLGAST